MFVEAEDYVRRTVTGAPFIAVVCQSMLVGTGKEVGARSSLAEANVKKTTLTLTLTVEYPSRFANQLVQGVDDRGSFFLGLDHLPIFGRFRSNS
jgi:hypothetical protein